MNIGDIIRWLLYAVAAIISFIVSELVVGLFLNAIITDFDKLLAANPFWGFFKIVLVVIVTVASLFGFIKLDRKSTRLNSSHLRRSRMPSSA